MLGRGLKQMLSAMAVKIVKREKEKEAEDEEIAVEELEDDD